MKEKLSTVAKSVSSANPNVKVIYRTADIGVFDVVDKAIGSAIEEIGDIDILINNVR